MTTINSTSSSARSPPPPYATKVISDKQPTEQDRRQTQQIIQYLKSQDGVFPTEEEEERRKLGLSDLNGIVAEWVREVTLSLGFSKQFAEQVQFRIETSGSYRLGVHSSSSDIDTVVIVPQHIDRRHFFGQLFDKLSFHPAVTGLISVSDAYVPVIKFYMHGVQIDLLLAILPKENIPDNFDLADDSILLNMDGESQRALNGPRVAIQILSLVPNLENYRLALRCVKFFGLRRGISSNSLGFLGGVSYAVLVGMVCQCYPNALLNVILSRFFKMYAGWNWGYKAAITMLSSEASIANPIMGFSVWNPQQNIRDRSVLMPIITPAYPPTNATFNMTRTTFEIIKSEFERGAEISFDALIGKRPWSSLFEESDFFVRYQNYLEVEVCADNHNDFRAWCAFVESRLRYLIQKLETVSANLKIHPCPDVFKDASRPKPVAYLYIGLNYIRQKKSGACEVDLTMQVQEFEDQICEWIGRKITMHRPVIRPVKRAHIPEFVYPSAKRNQLLAIRKKEKKRKSLEEDGSVSGTDNQRPIKKVRNDQFLPLTSVTTGTTKSGGSSNNNNNSNGAVVSIQHMTNGASNNIS